MFQLDHEEYRTITMVVLGVDKVDRVVTDRYWMTHPAIRVDGRGSPSRLVTTSNSERATPFLGVHHQKDTILWSNKHLKLRLSSGLILSRHWLHVESTMEPSWIISETATIKHFETYPLNFWIFVSLRYQCHVILLYFWYTSTGKNIKDDDVDERPQVQPPWNGIELEK